LRTTSSDDVAYGKGCFWVVAYSMGPLEVSYEVSGTYPEAGMFPFSLSYDFNIVDLL